jgi:hypothetical protein
MTTTKSHYAKRLHFIQGARLPDAHLLFIHSLKVHMGKTCLTLSYSELLFIFALEYVNRKNQKHKGGSKLQTQLLVYIGVVNLLGDNTHSRVHTHTHHKETRDLSDTKRK